MIILITGSRKFPRQNAAEIGIINLLREISNMADINRRNFHTTFICGGAEGTDSIAIKSLRYRGQRIFVLKPNYKKYGNYATHQRNDFMLNHANKVLAFWHGVYYKSGTASVIVKSIRDGIPVLINVWTDEGFRVMEEYEFKENVPPDWDWAKVLNKDGPFRRVDLEGQELYRCPKTGTDICPDPVRDGYVCDEECTRWKE